MVSGYWKTETCLIFLQKQEFSLILVHFLQIVKQIFIIHNFIYRIRNYRHGLCCGDAGSTNYLKKCKQHGQNWSVSD